MLEGKRDFGSAQHGVVVWYLSEGQLARGCSNVLGGGIEEPGPGRAQQLDGDAPSFLLLQSEDNRAKKYAQPCKGLGN